MDHRGYSKRIVDANAKATTDSLGVLLGRHCIRHEISAADIAKQFDVSRMTVYKWFTGEAEPRLKRRLRIQLFLAQEVKRLTRIE